MRSLVLSLAIVALAASSALATPGDPRILQGVLEWPQTLSTEPFIVIRAEDGRMYYTDIAGAQRRSPGPITTGTRVAVLGVEGSRPYEVGALVFGPGDAASLGLTMPPGAVSTPSASIAPGGAGASGPPAGPPAEPLWRLDGTVQGVSGATVRVKTSDGRTHAVDAGQLSAVTIRGLRPGDHVTLFGVPRADDRLVANGYIQSEPSPPAASPPSR
jgi:hypothetical protein